MALGHPFFAAWLEEEALHPLIKLPILPRREHNMVKCVPDKKRAADQDREGPCGHFCTAFSAAALGAIILSFPAAFLSR